MDQMTLVREFEDDVAPLSLAAEQAARARLRHEVARDGRRPARPARSPRSLAILTGVTAAAALLVAAATTSGPRSLPGWVQPASAAPLLQEAADDALLGPQLEYRDDQYLYIRTIVKETTSDEETGFADSRRFVNESWVSAANNRPSKIIEHGRTWMEGPWPGGTTWPPRTPEEMAQLPTDPDELLGAVMDHFSRGNSAGTDRETASMGLGMLISSVQAPPSVRAAGFEALARIPGVAVEEDLRVGDRPAIGIRIPSSPAQPMASEELIMIDRDTSEYLGTRTTSERWDQFIRLDTVAVVDSIDERP